ncbi:MAG: hypothetical protein O7D91_14000 [Planctomycetota bacterium]|nr:hypothetical protein [Planctomycetota bacterium]
MSCNLARQAVESLFDGVEVTSLVEVKCLCGQIHRFSPMLAGRMAKCPIRGYRFRVPERSGDMERLPRQVRRNVVKKPAPEKRAVRTGLRVVARFSPIHFMLGKCRPTIRVDGRSCLASWGRYEFIALGPGMHSVEASFSHPLRRKAGYEKIYLTVSRGQVRRLEYEAPQFAFLRGTFRELPLRQ